MPSLSQAQRRLATLLRHRAELSYSSALRTEVLAADAHRTNPIVLTAAALSALRLTTRDARAAALAVGVSAQRLSEIADNTRSNP